ncbi:MazG nucleotide pyrophosphohydrolase domain-containing protein [Streptomyces syringium]|uniref:MazG nucleotide pyrophosphohydrolase domain-containing protein n=1 Tax=Streptomyces syringium TaxID=76729 RepID=UPI0037D53C0A
MSGDLTIHAVQQQAWANKLAKGFNTVDAALEFGLAYGELAEAFDAWRKGESSLGEELADVLLYLVALAQMNGVDLEGETRRKLAINAAREYRTGSNGTLRKVGADVQEAPGV